jgi:SAM-dependent methyltransferase
MSAPLGWKDRLIDWLRRWHLLQAADTIGLAFVCLKNGRSNRAFCRAHPDFAVPPAALAYDAFGTVDWDAYCRSGREDAQRMAERIARHCQLPSLDVLEWGCGPGRVIRHLRQFLPIPLRLVGTDYNERSIAWCRPHLAGIDFVAHGLLPPIDLAASSVDCIYAISVLTHLSEPSHELWRAELLRLLRPHGLLILTTQGDNYRDRYLTAEEQKQFGQGQLVVRGEVREGKKWYSAFHPAEYMRQCFLSAMEVLEHVPGQWAPGGWHQDVWIARQSAAK